MDFMERANRQKRRHYREILDRYPEKCVVFCSRREAEAWFEKVWEAQDEDKL